jgi:HAMP domain-containing protein
MTKKTFKDMTPEEKRAYKREWARARAVGKPKQLNQIRSRGWSVGEYKRKTVYLPIELITRFENAVAGLQARGIKIDETEGAERSFTRTVREWERTYNNGNPFPTPDKPEKPQGRKKVD